MTLETMINGLSRDEQLIAMELLWVRLTQYATPTVPSDWHSEIVSKLAAAVESGEDTLSDWSDAKERLAERLR